MERLAHDVRTPLASLLMWVRLLRAGEADSETALAALEQSALQISATIDRLTEEAAEAAGETSAPRARRRS